MRLAFPPRWHCWLESSFCQVCAAPLAYSVAILETPFAGKWEEALKMLQKCVNVGYMESEALLLIARIHLANRNVQLCLQTLESALSTNFEVLCVCVCVCMHVCACVLVCSMSMCVGAAKCPVPSHKGPSRTAAADDRQK